MIFSKNEKLKQDKKKQHLEFFFWQISTPEQHMHCYRKRNGQCHRNGIGDPSSNDGPAACISYGASRLVKDTNPSVLLPGMSI